MKWLLAPGTAVMARLGFGRKFALLALIVALPLAVMMALLATDSQRDIDHAALERRGVQYVAALGGLLDAVQRHAASRDAGNAAVDAALDEVRAREARLGEQMGTSDRAQNIADHWIAMKKRGAAMGPNAAIGEHKALSDEIIDLMYFVAERSRLLLDPEGRSAYLQDASVSRLPEMIAASGHIGALLQDPSREPAIGRLAMAYQLA